MPGEKAILCLLLVRGAQTPGELRNRSERLFQFSTLEEVEKVLESLEEIGLTQKMPRRPGHKEHRYAHLMGGPPGDSEPAAGDEVFSHEIEPDHRLAALAREVALLQEELAELREELRAFRKQFE